MRATRFTKLLLIATTTVALIGSLGAPAQAAPRVAKIETYVQVLSPATIAAGSDRTTDYAKYGGCQLVRKRLQCWANPAAGGNSDPRPLWASVTFFVPAAVATRAVPGSLRMRVVPTFSQLSGRVDWDYGGNGHTLQFAHLPRKKAKTPKFADLTDSFTLNGRQTPTVDFGFYTNTRATFKKVLITYSYLVAAG